MNLRTVIIVTKPKQSEVARVAAELIQWFKDRKIDASMDSHSMSKPDLAVVIGGDGTLLAAARLLDDQQVPILAINHGSLGFLTKVTLKEMYPALERVLQGDFVTESRMMIEITVVRGDKRIAAYRALNDLVINKGTISRIIELEMRVDAHYVSTFRSDGLIIATPTGSTGYNLSAGGPIVFPSMSAMVVTPICSHTLTNRPIVLPPDVKIDVMLHSSHDEVYVTVDGQDGLPLQVDDRLAIERSEVDVKLVAPSDKDYFYVLRGKLKWG